MEENAEIPSPEEEPERIKREPLTEKPRHKKFGKRQVLCFKHHQKVRKQVGRYLPLYLEYLTQCRLDTSTLKSKFVGATLAKQAGMPYTLEVRDNLIGRGMELLEQLQEEMETIQDLYTTINQSISSREKMALSLDVQRSTLMDLLAYGGRNLPLWTGMLGETPPARIGRLMDDSMPFVGELVAAFTNEMWILAEVKEVRNDEELVIRDVDDDARTHYTIKREHILLLPLYRFDPKRTPSARFERRSIVLALYPQTTCFYKGIVECPPFSADDPYLITFEDEEYEGGYAPAVHVPQRYVLTFREHPSVSSASKMDIEDTPFSEEATPEPLAIPMMIRKRIKMRDSDDVPTEESIIMLGEANGVVLEGIKPANVNKVIIDRKVDEGIKILFRNDSVSKSRSPECESYRSSRQRRNSSAALELDVREDEDAETEDVIMADDSF